MKFYEDMSRHYDEVFPENPIKINFLIQHMHKEGLSIDIACGVGTDVRALIKKGYDIEGLDLDETMIKEAELKSKDQGISTRWITGSMTALDQYYEGETLANVLCTGNSLVHLPSVKEILVFIKQVYYCLKNEGKLVIQIINFDRILDNCIEELPTIINKKDRVQFIRKYEHKGNKIRFIGELDKDGKKTKNSIDLLSLRKEELVKILNEVGFKDIKVYGNFNGEIYSQESYATIVVATK